MMLFTKTRRNRDESFNGDNDKFYTKHERKKSSMRLSFGFFCIPSQEMQTSFSCILTVTSSRVGFNYPLAHPLPPS